MHYGVEGQKWGVRRYQNADGSLTAEGKAHYGLGELDYNARYSGNKKDARKAYKAERRALLKTVDKANRKDEAEWLDKYHDLEDGKGKYSKLGFDDYSGFKEAERDLEEESNEMFDSYTAGRKEVENYLKNKYGKDTVSSSNAKRNIAIGAGIVAGTAVLGATIYGVTREKSNNKLRADEDDLYNKLIESNSDYQHAKWVRQMAKDDERHLKEKSDESSRKLYEFLERPRNKNSISDAIDDANTEGLLKAQSALDKAYYNAAKDESDKAYNDMISTRGKREQVGSKYRDKAAERMAKTKGLWARPSDKARNARRTYATDYEKG